MDSGVEHPKPAFCDMADDDKRQHMNDEHVWYTSEEDDPQDLEDLHDDFHGDNSLWMHVHMP